MSSGAQNPVASPAIRRSALFGVLWSGTAFSVLLVAPRLVVRHKMCRRLRADDYFVIFALALYTSSTIVVTIYSDLIYNTLDNAANLVTVLETLNTNSKAMHGILASYLCLWTCLWSIKFSFMAFFANLGKQLRFQAIFWWCVLGFLVATYATCVGLLDYRCLTSQPLDIPEKCMSQRVINYEYVNTRVTTALDVVSDGLIVLIPSNLVWRIRMPWQKKLMLTGICCLTVCMAVVAVVRVTVASPGMLPDLSWLMLWNSVEMTLAIFVACIASFRSLYTRTMEIKKQRIQNNHQNRPLPWPKRRNGKLGGGGMLRSFMGSDALLTNESTLWRGDMPPELGGEPHQATHTVHVHAEPCKNKIKNNNYELQGSQAKLITVTSTFSTSKEEDTSFNTTSSSITATSDVSLDHDGGGMMGAGNGSTRRPEADVRVFPLEVVILPPPPPSVQYAEWERNCRDLEKGPGPWKY